MGHAVHTRKIRNAYRSLFEKADGNDILKHKRVDGRVILKRIFGVHKCRVKGRGLDA
jgi:hypothetical protein